MRIRCKPSKIRKGDGIAYIDLSDGREAIIDIIDIDKVKNYGWYSSRSGTNNNYRWYAVTWLGNGKVILLHKLLLDAPEDKQVDHKNGNSLDNRRKNIRISTQQENCQNRRKLNKPCSSKYKGVCWYKRDKRWGAWIQPPKTKRRYFIGSFDSEIEAAVAYNKAAIKLFGDYACLNAV